jgi:hypothetical protein
VVDSRSSSRKADNSDIVRRLSCLISISPSMARSGGYVVSKNDVQGRLVRLSERRAWRAGDARTIISELLVAGVWREGHLPKVYEGTVDEFGRSCADMPVYLRRAARRRWSKGANGGRV